MIEGSLTAVRRVRRSKTECIFLLHRYSCCYSSEYQQRRRSTYRPSPCLSSTTWSNPGSSRPAYAVDIRQGTNGSYHKCAELCTSNLPRSEAAGKSQCKLRSVEMSLRSEKSQGIFSPSSLISQVMRFTH